MKHVIIHPGFHKTATTSIQAFFGKNRKSLRPYLRFLSPNATRAASDAARNFSQSHDPIHLVAFQNALLESLRQPLTRKVDTLVVSNEDLLGCFPGSYGVKNYSAAPILAKTLAETIQAILPQNSHLTIYCSVREQRAWIRSAYQHCVTFFRNTDDLDLFSNAVGHAFDPAELKNTLATSLPKNVSLVTSLLEDEAAKPYGPATAIVDLVGLPQEANKNLLRIAKRNEALGPDALQTLLGINRSDLSDEQVKEQRTAVIAEIRSDRHSQFNDDPI